MDLEGECSSLSSVTTIFCSIGVDLSSLKDKSGLERFNNIIMIIQKCVKKNHGSLNKLLMDDKGTTLIVIFGVRLLCKTKVNPIQSQDCAARSISCGKSFVEELRKIGVKISIGIATGLVFSGVVGAPGGRREYSVLGDGVNLSARLMQAACKSEDHRILIDEVTATQAKNQMMTFFYDKIMVKGKSMPIDVYFPENTFLKSRQLLEKKLTRDDMAYLLTQLKDDFNNILTHGIPSSIEYNDDLQKILAISKGEIPLLPKIYGLDEEKDRVLENLKKGLDAQDQRRVPVTFLQGDGGTGKSFLLKHIFRDFNLYYPSKSLTSKTSFFLNSFSIEPHEYSESFNALHRFYLKMILVLRVHQSNKRNSDEDLIMACISERFANNEGVKNTVAENLAKFINLISTEKKEEIMYKSRVEEVDDKSITVGKIVIESLFSLYLAQVREALDVRLFILVFDNIQSIDKASHAIIRHLAEKFPTIHIFLSFMSDYQERPVALKSAAVEVFYKQAGLEINTIHVKNLGSQVLTLRLLYFCESLQ
jgi:class 3 adenylate cyclase